MPAPPPPPISRLSLVMYATFNSPTLKQGFGIWMPYNFLISEMELLEALLPKVAVGIKKVLAGEPEAVAMKVACSHLTTALGTPHHPLHAKTRINCRSVCCSVGLRVKLLVQAQLAGCQGGQKSMPWAWSLLCTGSSGRCSPATAQDPQNTLTRRGRLMLLYSFL